jgi:site-specific DNA recombinase
VGTDSYRFAGGRICDNTQVRVDQLDDYVWESVCEFLKDPERLIDEWSRRDNSSCLSSELERQRDEASRALSIQEKSIKRLLDAYEAGAVDLDELTQRTARTRTRVEQARLVLKEAEGRLSEVIELHTVVSHLDTFRKQVWERLDNTTWEERRQIIRALVSRVEIDAKEATVVYRVPITYTPSPTSSNDPSGKDESMHLSGRRAFTPIE